MNDSPFPFWLDSAEIAALEESICAELSRFINFGGHALYFSPLSGPELLREERRLLLPIPGIVGLFPVLRLDDVEVNAIEPLLPLLPGVAGLCLEKIVTSLGRDPDTGIESEETLIRNLESQIVSLRGGEKAPGCVGLVVMDFPEAASGTALRHTICELMPGIAAIMKRAAPVGCMIARFEKLSGRCAFIALFSATGRVACHRIARRFIAALEEIVIRDPVSGLPRSLKASAGHAIYPHDLAGRDMKLTPGEQALLLRERANVACEAAWNADHLPIPATAWGWIPMLCCTIQDVVASGVARLAYGSNAGIRQNQRFVVIPRGEPWQASSAIAQLSIRKVREKDAFADILRITASGREPAPGDGVILVREDGEVAAAAGILTSQTHFFAKIRLDAPESFALVITRPIQTVSREVHFPDSAEILTLLANWLPANAFAGRYGRDGICIWLPHANGSTARELLASLHQLAGRHGIQLASGIFAYPCLNFGRDECESCCLKALAYAELLPAPHIGLLDAFALAISADRHFSQGDETMALQEYRQALLLKPNDAMLLNSLGVCLAALNCSGEAARCFAQALQNCSDAALRARISYNLGNLHLKANEIQDARRCFELAVRSDSRHLFAWIRLARTHERAGRLNVARALYRHASGIAREEPDSLNIIQRQLARLEKESNDPERAREILHDSLIRNPADTASLLLLAQTYLQEDPAVAESLARKCLDLGQSARRVLCDALLALGRVDEARLIQLG